MIFYFTTQLGMEPVVSESGHEMLVPLVRRSPGRRCHPNRVQEVVVDRRQLFFEYAKEFSRGLRFLDVVLFHPVSHAQGCSDPLGRSGSAPSFVKPELFSGKWG